MSLLTERSCDACSSSDPVVRIAEPRLKGRTQHEGIRQFGRSACSYGRVLPHTTSDEALFKLTA